MAVNIRWICWLNPCAASAVITRRSVFELLNSLVTGKITGNYFCLARKAPWIAGFVNVNAQKQGINREYVDLPLSANIRETYICFRRTKNQEQGITGKLRQNALLNFQRSNSSAGLCRLGNHERGCNCMLQWICSGVKSKFVFYSRTDALHQQWSQSADCLRSRVQQFNLRRITS